jgi:hypothetical protein
MLFAGPDDDNFDGKQEVPDMDALQKWIQQKRMVTLKELGGDLALSGEVRTEMQVIHENKSRAHPNEQRGPRGQFYNKPTIGFDVEVNLMLDYSSERTWAAIKLEFNNDAGTVSGTAKNINLEKAFFGGRAYDGETITWDLEIGRRNLYQVFDSKVEFCSLFDGVLSKLSKASDAMGNYYINFGALLVDDRFNHYAYVGEMGMLDVASTGFFSKFSFIDWSHYNDYNRTNDKHENAQGYLHRYDFMVSQLMIGYQSNLVKWNNKLLKVYLAGLNNCDAEPLTVTKPVRVINPDGSYTINFVDLHKKRKFNYGFYLGTSIGQVRKAHDWALDVNFQYVEPQLIPDFDCAGIGRGNAGGVGFYTQNLDGSGRVFTNSIDRTGNGNYKGLSAEFLYAITNNLTMQNTFQCSTNQTKWMGSNFHYWNYEIEFIYAF